MPAKKKKKGKAAVPNAFKRLNKGLPSRGRSASSSVLENDMILLKRRGCGCPKRPSSVESRYSRG